VKRWVLNVLALLSLLVALAIANAWIAAFRFAWFHRTFPWVATGTGLKFETTRTTFSVTGFRSVDPFALSEDEFRTWLSPEHYHALRYLGFRFEYGRRGWTLYGYGELQRAWGQCVIGVPPPLAIAAFLVYPALRARRELRGRSKVAGLCPNCGYDLRASPIRCPECGEPRRVAAGYAQLQGHS
jgi:hypothetical protein